MPLQQQQLLHNGKEMKNTQKLSSLGVNDGDLVMMVSKASTSSRCFIFLICNVCICLCFYVCIAAC